jgi:hypothetical protein
MVIITLFGIPAAARRVTRPARRPMVGEADGVAE